LLKRLDHVLPRLRVLLHARSPPGESRAGSALLQTLEHLHSLHGGEDPLKAFQLAYQADLLACR